jgi:hypothetical protein
MCGNLAIPNPFMAIVWRHSGVDSHLLIDSKGQNQEYGKKINNEQHKEAGNVKNCIGGRRQEYPDVRVHDA